MWCRKLKNYIVWETEVTTVIHVNHLIDGYITVVRYTRSSPSRYNSVLQCDAENWKTKRYVGHLGNDNDHWRLFIYLIYVHIVFICIALFIASLERGVCLWLWVKRVELNCKFRECCGLIGVTFLNPFNDLWFCNMSIEQSLGFFTPYTGRLFVHVISHYHWQ